MDERDIEKTAFCTPWGNSSSLRCPLDSGTLRQLFKDISQMFLGGWSCLQGAYIDGILVYSQTWRASPAPERNAGKIKTTRSNG